MTQNLVITSSPHFRAKDTTRTIMLDVLIALCPALIASVIWFGPRALLVSAVCVGASVLFEYTYRKLMHLDMTIGDLSAAVTGLLLAFNLPSSIPLWMAVIGCFVSIIIIKQLFGGIGKNFANPAIVGRIVLLISFATPMTNWPVPLGTDAVTGPTPLGMVSAMEAAGVDAASSATPPSLPTYIDMFLGKIGGSLGETCTLALLIGFVYLVIRKVITITEPVAFVGTVFVLSWLLGADPIFHVLAGGVMLGAIFMGTDYVTTPTTETGRLIFGIGAGILTVVIRLYGAYPEGVSFAILIMNIVTPHIDNLTRIKALGAEGGKKA